MMQERDKLAHKLEGFEKTLAQLQQTVISMADTQGQPSVVNSAATPPFKSSQASLPDLIHVGKRCDLCDWKKQVLARGEVCVVDPTVEVHGAELGDGNFSVVLIEIIVAHAELWKEDGYHHTLGEVGVGGFVVWPRQFITLFP